MARWLQMLLSLAASTALSADPFATEIPGVVAVIDVPGGQLVNGIPVSFNAVVSKEKMENLENHFIKVFKKAQLYIPPSKEQLDIGPISAQLTGIDPDTLTSYTAILQPNADGTTTVIMGQALMKERKTPSGPDFVPLFPGAQAVTRAELEGLKTLSFEARGTSQELSTFYRDTLGKAGYREKEPGVFQKGNEQVTVRAKAVKSEGRLGVLITSRHVLAESAAELHPSADP